LEEQRVDWRRVLEKAFNERLKELDYLRDNDRRVVRREPRKSPGS